MINLLLEPRKIFQIPLCPRQRHLLVLEFCNSAKFVLHIMLFLKFLLLKAYKQNLKINTRQYSILLIFFFFKSVYWTLCTLFPLACKVTSHHSHSQVTINKSGRPQIKSNNIQRSLIHSVTAAWVLFSSASNLYHKVQSQLSPKTGWSFKNKICEMANENWKLNDRIYHSNNNKHWSLVSLVIQTLESELINWNLRFWFINKHSFTVAFFLGNPYAVLWVNFPPNT